MLLHAKVIWKGQGCYSYYNFVFIMVLRVSEEECSLRTVIMEI